MNKKIKKQLKQFAKLYKQLKSDFFDYQENLIKGFDLKKNERKHLFFGLIEPTNSTLKQYANLLNSNKDLIKLNAEVNELLFKGNMIIVNLLNKHYKAIGGYNLDLFVEDPIQNAEEIENFILGLAGYEHIHLIGEKVALEIPVKEYIPEQKKIIKLAEYWIRKTK